MKSLVAALVMFVTLSACGEDTQTEYSTEVRDNFLAACTSAETDSLLTSRLCVCVFDEAQSRVPFARFQEYELEIAQNPNTELRLAMAQIVADCVISESGL